MADDTVLIAIKAIDDASAALNKVASSLGALDDKIESTQNEFKRSDAASSDFTRGVKETGDAVDNADKRFKIFHLTLTDIQSAFGLVQQGIGYFKQAWDFAKEGAAIERINAQFNNMASNVGVDADNLVKALDKAAHGTVDDEELMQTATRALALGLTTNTKDLVGLMEVARASSVAFGGDTATAFERISTAVENLTPRALKQAGIIVDLKSAYEAYAKAQGKIPDQLTDEEKRQALLNQVLAKGADLIKKVGDAGEDSATRMSRFEARVNNLIDEFKVGEVNAIDPWLIKIDTFQTMLDPTASDADKLRASLANMRANGIEPNAEAVAVLNAKLEEMDAQTRKSADAVTSFKNSIGGGFIFKNMATAVKEIGDASQRAADGTAYWGSALQRAQLTPTYDAVDRAIRRTADAAASLRTQIALGAAQKFVLDVGISGRLVTETKQFSQSQTDLQKRLKETAAELAALEGKQGAVDKTTIKNAMSANQLKLAYAQLAAMQGRLSKETDPAKQAELAAQIGIQQDRINGANSAVSSYIDNSKRIEQLKGTYNDLTAQVEANARAHDEASKRILFDYAQQAIVQQNLRDNIPAMTKAQTDALDALAVKWHIKSQADVDAMNQMLLAAKTLASDGSLDEFGAIAQGALEGPRKPSEDLIKLMQGMQKEASDKMPKVAKSIGDVKQPTKDLLTQMTNLQTNATTGSTRLQQMNQYGVVPLTKAFDLLNISVASFNTLIGQMPTTIPIPTATTPTTTTGPTCFAAGTPILMTDGSTTPIEQIAIGDTVQSFDSYGELVKGRVTSLQQREADEYFSLVFDCATVFVTGEHPFYAPQITHSFHAVHGAFIRAHDLQVGDKVEAFIDGQRRSAQLITTNREITPTIVYNFNVAITHTYIANGLMVHNVKIAGAQKGANYIVPPGYPNDTYYQRVSSGEHVQVTPQGKSSMNGLNISKVEINVGGTNASIPQIQQAVWTEMTRVIEAAQRTSR